MLSKRRSTAGFLQARKLPSTAFQLFAKARYDQASLSSGTLPSISWLSLAQACVNVDRKEQLFLDQSSVILDVLD